MIRNAQICPFPVEVTQLLFIHFTYHGPDTVLNIWYT